MLFGCSKEIGYSGGPQAPGVEILVLLGSRKRLFWVSPRIENLYCEICRQKKLLDRGNFSRRQLAPNSNFLPCDKLKIQIQRGLIFINLGFPLTIRYDFLSLVKVKNDLGPKQKVMLQGF
jgi:hypothetical protein